MLFGKSTTIYKYLAIVFFNAKNPFLKTVKPRPIRK